MRTLHVIRAAGLVERGMLSLDDMDRWYLEATEYAAADRMRLIEERRREGGKVQHG